MYAKLMNGVLHGLRMPIKAEHEDIFTNDESIIRQYGYKQVLSAEMPSENAVSHWEENDTEIIQVWE